MKKKILWSIILGEIVLLLAGIGALALFSDTETASNNAFTANSLNLQVGVDDPCEETFSIGSLSPGTTGTTADWTLQKTGVNGDLSIAVGSITNAENTCYEPETDDGDAGAAAGELGAYLTVAFWMDVDRNAAWSSGDYYLASNESKISWTDGTTIPGLAYDVLDNYGGNAWADVQTNLGNGNIADFMVSYNLPSATSDVVQSDSSTFDIVFTLEQS